jgi:hypothetical protein
MKKEATSKCKELKQKMSNEKRGNPETQGAQIKDHRWKKRQPQNTRGSNERHLMKKEATPNDKGLKWKTSNGKRGKSHKSDVFNQTGIVSSLKPASLN